MNRRNPPLSPPRPLLVALACALSLSGVLGGCSVHWRSGSRAEYGTTSTSTGGSGAERPRQTEREPKRAPSGRDNVERVTVRTRPAARPANAQQGTSGRGSAPDRGAVTPNAPVASGAASGESGTPVPTPESTSPVAPPRPPAPDAPNERGPEEVDAEGEPVVEPKDVDKREGEPHYAPRDRKPVKRTPATVKPKQDRDRGSSEPAQPVAPKTDRTR